jgi:hypothetical protein
MQEFLNPKSMITPGIAGGLIMLITNTCADQFGLPPKWTALVLSFLLALIVVAIAAVALWQKALLWLFNALIIFSTAVGTNQTSAKLSGETPEPRVALAPASPAAAFLVASPTPGISSARIVSESPVASATPHEPLPLMVGAAPPRKRFFKSWLNE